MTDEKSAGAPPGSPPPPACSRGAKRMRRSRQRRKDGLRCLIIEIRDAEIDALVRRGLLVPDARNQRRAILKALYAFLDHSLGGTP